MVEGALEGVKVVDLTQSVAGPFCTKLLADYGAEVIKVERPDGDPSRRLGPFPGDLPDPEKSGLFLYLNTNKKGVTLNLKTADGRGLLKELIADADLLVENFAPRVMPKLGFAYSDVELLNPRLVMISISNFGQTGPYRDYESAELVQQAMGGLMYLTGDIDREPLKLAVTQAQYLGGATGAAAAMTGLHYQRMTGEGQHVDVSIMEVMASMYFGVISNYAYQGVVQVRGANDMYRAADGYVVPTSGTRPWTDYVNFLGLPELADPKYASPDNRIIHEAEIREKIESVLAKRNRRDWTRAGQAAGFPFGFLQDVSDLASCPHLEARNYWVTLDHPAAGRQTYPVAPFKMSESPMTIRCPAPLLGQHNEEIFCGKLGYSKAELARLRSLGVI